MDLKHKRTSYQEKKGGITRKNYEKGKVFIPPMGSQRPKFRGRAKTRKINKRARSKEREERGNNQKKL